MNFESLEGLLQSSEGRHASLSPEELESLGKSAASMFVNEGIPLNRSVVKLASAHHGINAEQIKRICETANTAVYLSRHDQTKTAGFSYPKFELADPARVIQDLSSDARPTVEGSISSDYCSTPGMKEKTSEMDLIRNMFGEKIASIVETGEVEVTESSAFKEVMDTKRTLDDLRSNLVSSAEDCDLCLKYASAEYYKTVRNHLLSGGSFSDVVVSARASIGDSEKVSSVLSPIVAQLLKEKIASPNQLREETRGIAKVAHRVLNPSHPLVVLSAEVSNFSDEIDKVAVALHDVDNEIGRVTSFIRENFGNARSA